jgi:hypothetical protein
MFVAAGAKADADAFSNGGFAAADADAAAFTKGGFASAGADASASSRGGLASASADATAFSKGGGAASARESSLLCACKAATSCIQHTAVHGLLPQIIILSEVTSIAYQRMHTHAETSQQLVLPCQ